ncbi:MAG TPA: C40 family peptidase [Candidatus Scybalocola faecipullorum]|nr:C40 family peptidase [Candidatus Scybalocola faecipullorum]
MIPWNLEILRNELIGLMLSLEGKIRYTQDERRDLIEEGYGDCSSVVRWVYLQVLQTDIGEDTAVQIISHHGRDVDENRYPDRLKLLPGDLLFFTGHDHTRPYSVGHVEMYIGDGMLAGQNDRKVPGIFIKPMDTYIRDIYKNGHHYIKTRRYMDS